MHKPTNHPALHPSLSAICVYMGSSSGNRPEYAQAAQALGTEIALHNLELVYGGGSVGLMGITADAALASGGRVLGVITEALKDMEVGHDQLSELAVVPGMHERKALMARRADAFVALPGGFGTMDEFFEIITWAQLGIHGKPCGLLNVEGYFDKLIEFMAHSVTERFVHGDHHNNLIVARTPAELIAGFNAHYHSPPASAQKWIDTPR